MMLRSAVLPLVAALCAAGAFVEEDGTKTATATTAVMPPGGSTAAAAAEMATAAGPSVVATVQFEPIAGGGPAPEELLQLLAGGLPEAPLDGAEADLGPIFAQVLAGPPARARRSRRGISMDMRGGDLTIEMMGPADAGDPAAALFDALRGPSAMPASDLADLFPLPVATATADAGFPGAADPFEADEVLSGILGHMVASFRQDMLPAIHQATRDASPADPCRLDARRLCPGAGSVLQCLGARAANVSGPCRDDIGRSVPFLCATDIDRRCDLLQRGVLPCLADRLKDLDADCRAAVVATHAAVVKVNSQKASLVDAPGAPAPTVHVPKLPPPPVPAGATVAPAPATATAPMGGARGVAEAATAGFSSNPSPVDDLQGALRGPPAGHQEVSRAMAMALGGTLVVVAAVVGAARTGCMDPRSKRSLFGVGTASLLELERAPDFRHIA